MKQLREILRGRYGFDGLSAGLLFVAVLMDLINLFPFVKDKMILGCLALLPIIVCILRAFSKNILLRKKENQIFLKLLSVFGGNQKEKPSRETRKLFKFFKCPNCGQKVRVPRGKGKVEILCPKCSNKFIKKT